MIKIRKYNRDFAPSDIVLLFNSRLRLLPYKMRSKWLGPFDVVQLLDYSSIELENHDGKRLKVNGQQVKAYLRTTDEIKVVETWALGEI